MTQTSRFISLEGGEGAGKTTLLTGLQRKLEASDETVSVTREPGGTPLAEQLRSLLLSNAANDPAMSTMTEALLLATARRDHVDGFIKPRLKAGHFVLCDRFIDSTRAYQGVALSSDAINTLEELATDGLKPVITFVLDAPPSALKMRREQRGLNTDRFESRSMEFHDRVRKAFLDIARENPGRVIVLDALLPADELLEHAWSHICDRCDLSFNAPSSAGRL